MLDFHYRPKATWGVMSINYILFTVHLFWSEAGVYGQFSDVTMDYNLYVESASVNVESGVSFHDYNRDGLDDLTYGSIDMGVYTYRNTGSGFEQDYFFSAIAGAIQHPIWVDYDNDGDSDFFTTRFRDCPVLMRNLGDMTFEDVSSVLECSVPDPNNTCASWADYDNDGFLDLYIANYYPTTAGLTSWCYHNNGDGTFTENAAELGIDNGVTPTYQVLWIDYDIDGDQDLLICNDKFVGNRLYRNNGLGAFTDESTATGFDVAINAMSLSPGDSDRDGDFDFYISNTTEGNVLMIQQSGVFSDGAESMGALVNANCWGSVFIDTEGKMWEDIYVVATGPQTGSNRLLKNQSGTVFTSDANAFQGEDEEYLYSVAKGDSNGDGRYDIACNPYQNNQSLLFESDSPDSTAVKIVLQGTVSNRDGIGSIIKCHVGETLQLRAKTCGENYLSQDSQYILFASKGLPIDSIVIQWPSGIRDVIYNPLPGQIHVVIENQPEGIVDVVELSMCQGDTLYLQPQAASSVEWSTGSQEPELPVYSAGEYTATVTNEDGLVYDVTFSVSVNPELNVEIQVTEPTCAGASNGVIQWPGSDVMQVWINDNEVTGAELTGLASGQYNLHAVNAYGCEVDSAIVLADPPMLNVEATVIPGCHGADSEYSLSVEHAQGDAIVLGLESISGMLPQGNYDFIVLDQQGCTFSSVLTVETLPPFEVQPYSSVLCASDSVAQVVLQFSGGIAPLSQVGEGVPLEALPPGEYNSQWIDAAGCIAQGAITILQFDPIEIEVEQEFGQIILEIEGGYPPYEVAWDNGSTGLIIEAEPGFYSFVVTDNAGCTAESEVDMLVNLQEVTSPELSAYPMPFDDVLHWKGVIPRFWSVYDAQGRLVINQNSQQWGTWVTRDWPRGMYVVRLTMSDHSQQTRRLIKD